MLKFLVPFIALLAMLTGCGSSGTPASVTQGTSDMLWDTLVPPQTAVTNSGRAAIDDQGRVMLVWRTTTGTYASINTNGDWSPPVNLGQVGFINPISIVSANDNFAVFWQVRNGNMIELYCARYDSGVWQPTTALGSFAADALRLDAAMFSDGSLFIIYSIVSPDGLQAYSRRFDVSQGWQSPEPLGQTLFTCGFHRSGKAVIAWSDSTDNAYVRSYDVNGSWAAPVSIGQYSYVTAHSVAINGAGDAMVVVSTASDIRVATNMQGAGWTQLMPIFQKEQSTSYTPPQLALDRDGNAMLVFAVSSSSARYLAIQYTSSSGWQQPVDINWGKVPDLLQLVNNLKADEAGNYLLVWQGYDAIPGIEHVYCSRFQYGVGWKAPEYMGKLDTDAAFPNIAMNQLGEAVATWWNIYPPMDANSTVTTMSLGIGLFH